MAIERPMGQDPFNGLLQQQDEADLEIGIVNPEAVSIDTPDGGVLIDFEPDGYMIGGEEHNAKLADLIEDEDLPQIAS